MKFLGRLITLLLAIFIGFWLGTTGLLNNTQIGYWMNTVVEYLPDRQDFEQLGGSFDSVPLLSESVQQDDEITETENSPIIASNVSDEVDYSIVEETIIQLVNELRTDLGLNTVQSNDMLKAAAIIRAQETEELFSHTRPNGEDAFSVFDEEGITYPYRAAGENLGMATNYLNEADMAELLFNGWVESEGHYENMIRPEYEQIGVGVHFDGEFLYATQLFGTPL